MSQIIKLPDQKEPEWKKAGDVLFIITIMSVCLLLLIACIHSCNRVNQVQAEPVTQTSTAQAVTPTATAQGAVTPTEVVPVFLADITMEDLPMNKPVEFAEYLMPYAKEIEDVYGIPANVIVAQAALETGWGKRIQENNILGIGHTVGKRHLGRVKRNGKVVKLYVTTYSYESINACLEAYAEMITTKPNYKRAMANIGDYRKFIAGLVSGGYSRDKRYESKLLKIISKYIK